MATKRNSVKTTPEPQGTGAHLQSASQHLLQAAREAAAGVSEAQVAARTAFYEGVANARPEVSAAGSDVREAGHAAAAQVQHQWEEVRQRSEGFVREHPLAALGIAAAGGFLLSRLLRR
jgi:ElaB/YqjD/DUF883 family membrane-anchored ribosome-binding protein